MDEKRAAMLLGTLERRTRPAEVEIRSDGDSNSFTVRGYASVVEHAYDVYGGPEKGGWTETIARDAFAKTLADNPDVAFLINHDGIPLARTRSGTLTLSADNTGLASEASIDGASPLGQTLRSAMGRGDLDQMSFGFRVTRQEWNEEYTERRITEVSLDHGDVSIVTYPANPATSMSIVSARSAVNFLRESELAEIRAEVTPDELREARERLDGLLSGLMTPDEVRAADAEDDAEEREETAAGTVTVDVELGTINADGLRELVERMVADALRAAAPAAEDEQPPAEDEERTEDSTETEERAEEAPAETEVRSGGLSLAHARRLALLDI
jgi:HK97 family phage prohead protease